MKCVYLAGPITGLTYGDCTDWREHAVKSLAEAGIKGLSPMRSKDYLKQITAPLSGTCEEYEHLGVMSTPRGIMTRDRFDATRCDVLLVNLLGAKTVSIGTVMEIAWADGVRTPIVCAMEPERENIHSHAMLFEAIGMRVPTLEEAIHVAKCILS